MTTEELERLDALRLRYLKEVHEASKGEENCFVPDQWVEERLGIAREEGHSVRQYLEGEFLVKARGTGYTVMTHRGNMEIEEALREPQRTEHFSASAVSLVLHVGSISNSNVQVGSSRSSQTLQAPALNPNQLLALRNTLDNIAMRVQDLGLPPDQRQQVQDLIASARLVLSTPQHHGVLREAVKSLRNILDGMVANGVRAGFFAELAALPF